jgi:hypothetical protein
LDPLTNGKQLAEEKSISFHELISMYRSMVDLDMVVLGRNFAVASLSGDSDGRGPGSFTADRPYRE